MGMLHEAMQFYHCINKAATPADIAEIMTDITQALGFQYFALTQHVADPGRQAIHIHNYPEQWANIYAADRLSLSDPVHRACDRTSWGFQWAAIPSLVPMSRKDKEQLLRGRKAGIGDGFTVPAGIRGEPPGSCTFANASNVSLRQDVLFVAQLVGSYAFHMARQLISVKSASTGTVTITDRQRDCVRWAARGKGDWEISQILGISKETATSHVKGACARYQVNKRIALIGPMLDDGTLTISDLFP
jgi:LuxR family quorum-sensing system transcriptional regulator CciR